MLCGFSNLSVDFSAECLTYRRNKLFYDRIAQQKNSTPCKSGLELLLPAKTYIVECMYILYLCVHTRKRRVKCEDDEARLPWDWLDKWPWLNYHRQVANKRDKPSQHIMKAHPSLSQTAVKTTHCFICTLHARNNLSLWIQTRPYIEKMFTVKCVFRQLQMWHYRDKYQDHWNVHGSIWKTTGSIKTTVDYVISIHAVTLVKMLSCCDKCHLSKPIKMCLCSFETC